MPVRGLSAVLNTFSLLCSFNPHIFLSVRGTTQFTDEEIKVTGLVGIRAMFTNPEIRRYIQNGWESGVGLEKPWVGVLLKT